LLGAIEAVRPRDVALVRIEPRTKDRVVLITAQADDMGRLVDYMGQVSRTAPFVRVSPTRQEVVLEGEHLRKRASFEAYWEDRP
jgi:rRNA processing protein Gar1